MNTNAILAGLHHRPYGDVMKQFNALSKIQKICYKEVCGYEYIEKQLTGSFLTDRPNDKKWDLSPWQFSFVFQKETGYLICELDHRMSNNRTFGWDSNGKEIDRRIIDKIYPPHL